VGRTGWIAIVALALAGCAPRGAVPLEDRLAADAQFLVVVENRSEHVLRLSALNGNEESWIGNVGSTQTRTIPVPQGLPGGSAIMRIRVFAPGGGGVFETPVLTPKHGSQLWLEVPRDVAMTAWELR
jgi:hypothetical protein